MLGVFGCEGKGKGPPEIEGDIGTETGWVAGKQPGSIPENYSDIIHERILHFVGGMLFLLLWWRGEYWWYFDARSRGGAFS